MREIKFRVWDGQRMHYLKKGENINLCFFSEGIPWGVYDSATEARLVTGDPNAVLNEPGKLMQYTGVNDKHGNEMCESDIVRCGYGIGVIVFNAGCFMVEWIDDRESNMELLFSRKGTYRRKGDEEFELVGTIYTDPELLTNNLK